MPRTILPVTLCLLLATVGLVAAQTRPRPATPAPAPIAQAPPASPPAPAPVVDPNPSAPQQTTATFVDWVLRCTRIGAAAQSCELVQGISSQERTVAQVAIGRVGKGQPLQLTALVPPSVNIVPPAFLAARENEPAMLDLAWRRCLPGGCIADGPVPDELLARIRALAEPARIVYVDAAGRQVALPLSPRGLPQALAALAKSETD